MFLKSPYSQGTIANDNTTGNLNISLTQSREAIPVNGTGQLAKIRITITKAIVYSWRLNATNLLQCSLRLNDVAVGVKFKETRQLEQYNNEIITYEGHYEFKPVPGDLNLDGKTDITDLCAVGKAYKKTGESFFDLNGDLIVDMQDLLLVAVNMGRTKP
jgi:hypothetical protein